MDFFKILDTFSHFFLNTQLLTYLLFGKICFSGLANESLKEFTVPAFVWWWHPLHWGLLRRTIQSQSIWLVGCGWLSAGGIFLRSARFRVAVTARGGQLVTGSPAFTALVQDFVVLPFFVVLFGGNGSLGGP